MRRRIPSDWQRIEALARDGYGWEDIVVLMRKLAHKEHRVFTWAPEQIRNYVIKGIRP